MNKKFQFASLLLVVAVSIVFGMVINSMLNRVPKVSAETPLYSTIPQNVPMVQAPNFADIAEKANPAVVSIDVKIKVAQQSLEEFMPFDDFMWRFFGLPERRERRDNRDQQFRRRSPEQQYQEIEGGGSGFVIGSDGYILTNNHVVENAVQIMVILENDDEYEAKVIGTDPQIDVALLKIEPKTQLSVLPLGDSEKLRVGEWVIAIGNPLALKHTVTVGVVSAKSRNSVDAPLTSFIQTDAAINFGNSGGPLLNARGEVIGINTAIYRANHAEGIGFAIPINQVKSILEQLKTKGKVSHGYLGIVVRAVDEEMQDYYKLPSKKGAFIDSVTPGLPGDKAGIKRGDIILSVDGKDVKDNSDLVEAISSKAAGEVAQIEIFRNGKKISLEAKLGERPSPGEEGGQRPPEKREESGSYDKFGFDVDALTQEYRYTYQLDERVQGVIVIDVKSASEAERKGISEGQVVTEVNGTIVKNVADFDREVGKIRKNEVVQFQIMTPDGSSHHIFLRAEK